MIAPYEGRVSIDLGTGDGRFAYLQARRCPSRFFIGIDPVPEAIAAYSSRALRKPSKGGLDNSLFAVGALDSLPSELRGITDQLTILFPWGSLLRAVALPDPCGLQNMARLCRPGASLEVLLSYDGATDTRARELGLGEITTCGLEAMAPSYAASGFTLRAVEELPLVEARSIETTWAKRLAYGRPRQFWRLRARRSG